MDLPFLLLYYAFVPDLLRAPMLVIPCRRAVGIAARRGGIGLVPFARERGFAYPSFLAKAVMHNKSMLC